MNASYSLPTADNLDRGKQIKVRLCSWAIVLSAVCVATLTEYVEAQPTQGPRQDEANDTSDVHATGFTHTPGHDVAGHVL